MKLSLLPLKKLVAVAAVSAALPAGHAYAPAPNKVFQGVATKPVSAYTDEVHKHPAVYQEFIGWGQWLPGITQDALTNRARMMMMVSTRFGSKNEITPQGIAQGAGDAWLMGLAQQIYQSGNITYMRLMAEMNNCNNAYSAYNCNGSSRGPAYSAAEFKQAWRRATLIFRGGPVTAIDNELRKLGMPPLHTNSANLPEAPVAMVWVPMVGGNPDTAGNEPGAYFPGKRWVDWVGTDFYSRYPNWNGLNTFYDDYSGYPFAFGEYAIWDGDAPSWASTLFSWVNSHRRTQMMVYNDAGNLFWLSHFPASAGVIAKSLTNPRYLSYAPEWVPGGTGPTLGALAQQTAADTTTTPS